MSSLVKIVGHHWYIGIKWLFTTAGTARMARAVILQNLRNHDRRRYKKPVARIEATWKRDLNHRYRTVDVPISRLLYYQNVQLNWIFQMKSHRNSLFISKWGSTQEMKNERRKRNKHLLNLNEKMENCRRLSNCNDIGKICYWRRWKWTLAWSDTCLTQ